MVEFISTETITRTFHLNSIETEEIFCYRVFGDFKSAVNTLIKGGINLNNEIFREESLVSVKRFYSLLRKNSCISAKLSKLEIKERLLRCAAQYAYFSIRNLKQTRNLCSEIAQVMSEDSSWNKFRRDSWFLWDLSKKSKKRRDNLNVKLLNQIKNKHNSIYPEQNRMCNAHLINNYFRHIRKIILSNLQRKDIKINIDSEYCIKTIREHYSSEYIDTLISKFKTQISTLLTRQFKKYKKNEISEKSDGNKQSNVPVLKTIYSICKTKKIHNVEIEEWKLKKELWLIRYIDEIRDFFKSECVNQEINRGIKRLQEKPTVYFLAMFLEKKIFKLRRKIQGEPVRDFYFFLSQIIDYHLTHLILETQQMVILPKIRMILLDFILKPLSYLKMPIFTKSVIPLGIDDNQVYTLEELQSEVKITLSFYPNQKKHFKLSSPERYFELTMNNAKPARGILSAHGGKLQLAIPFTRRLPELSKIKPLEKQRILNCDLGLKSFAVLSITENGFETHRKFLDQKQLTGSKNSWFLAKSFRNKNTKTREKPTINYKFNLMKLRKKINNLQSELKMMKEETKRRRSKNKNYPKYKNTKLYWYKKRELKSYWNRIRNIHKELIHQISTRIVEYANYHQVDTIRFEDLRWTQHSAKHEVGYFLSFWQVHWFFSQIIEYTSQIARRYMIRSVLTNPYKSSQICSTCEKEGKRQRKIFMCSNELCGLILDSDLNAARNLGKKSRKCYPIRL